MIYNVLFEISYHQNKATAHYREQIVTSTWVNRSGKFGFQLEKNLEKARSIWAISIVGCWA